MIIKDYYIKDDLEYIIINDIIKYLINNNMQYLYIKETNELHFDNYILRFKKEKDLKKIIFDEFLNIINSLCDSSYCKVLDYKDLITNNISYKKNNFKNIKKIDNIKIDTKGKVKKLNKKLTPIRKIYK